MPPPSSSSKTYLELHGNTWRVTLNVPKELRGELGTKLKRSLQTDSLTVANHLKWDVIAELKGIIDAAKSPGMSNGDIMIEAKRFARLRGAAVGNEEGFQTVMDQIADRAYDIAGAPIGSNNQGEAIYDPEDEALANKFYGVASGKRTQIKEHHDHYLRTLNVKPRTKADDERAMRYLLEWCDKNNAPTALQTFTKPEAIRFADDIASVAGDLSPRTLNKYIRRLGIYWKWLENRGEVKNNIWEGRTLVVPKTPHDQEERPFTKDEMMRLLKGEASPQLSDLMRIAALTGCRLDPIVCLKVKDCDGGTFTFKPQKKERSPRFCPIHPALEEIVCRRSEGKSPEDDMFPEWPPVLTGMRERSFKASNHFTKYRRSVGVEETVPGKRRSLVNFHSFRRWFITEAERADQPPHIISAVVGHKREGATLGIYSAGPHLEQARRCVEAVVLPE